MILLKEICVSEFAVKTDFRERDCKDVNRKRLAQESAYERKLLKL
jgi:hypothetical protein